jgi:hypothetical protein
MSEKSGQNVYEQIGVAMTCRSYKEYAAMFALNEAVVSGGPVLDAAAGASSFSAELRSRGITAVSADPLYAMGLNEIADHGRREIEISTGKLAELTDIFNWEFYESLDRHRENRECSLETFLADYAHPDSQAAYVPARLPELPFADGTFSLVVCSHFLFLYGKQFDLDFHRKALAELVRVCRKGGQVRIYPLLDLHWKPYEHLDTLMEELRSSGIRPGLEPARLPFIPESSQLLVLTK